MWIPNRWQPRVIWGGLFVAAVCFLALAPRFHESAAFRSDEWEVLRVFVEPAAELLGVFVAIAAGLFLLYVESKNDRQ